MAIYDINGSQLTGDAAPGNILKGKSLCCTGDSLTAGAGVNNVFALTFGGICAEQNGMTYTNAGANGATITTCNATNNFMIKYQNIKEHDYLVFWYGFNDFRYGTKPFKNAYCQEVYGVDFDDLDYDTKIAVNALKDWDSLFVGDIDGMDPATWCGAWNTVLAHFTKTYPDMHIGVILPIITSATLKEPMRNALVTMCKKFGIPYLDSMNVNDWCCFGFTEGISDEMKNYYFTTRTGDGYLHPNERAYRMMANQLTEFLRRI